MEAGMLLAAGSAVVLVGAMAAFGKPKSEEDKPKRPDNKHRKGKK